MSLRMKRLMAAVAACLGAGGLGVLAQPKAAAPQKITPAQAEHFEAKVRPVLVANCGDCHDDTAAGGLRLDSREAVLAGGKSGPAVVPGDPDASLLIEAIRQTGTAPKMPMGRGRLASADVATLEAWVKEGAYWPGGGAAAPAPAKAAAGMVVTAQHRAFWSLQPLASHTPPVVKNTAWVKTDIDRFILARLEKEGLTPAPPADKRTLLRRATLTLTGLPPTPEEVEAFEKDGSADAFAKVVDRLLASPRYGEHWARWWLDVARYAEDDPRSLDPQRRGYNPYPNAYLYRDWVIKALNDDLPYDAFVRAQLAADQMDERVRARMLPALGFLGLGPWYYDNGAVEVTRADERHDRVDVVTRGFLGLTVACARCHDHKYDPIPTKDYYSLAGVFLNTEYHEYPRVPLAVAHEYDAEEKRIEKKEELLGEFLSRESAQLAEALALQVSRYVQAAWRVAGEPRESLAVVVNQEKLDYELADRFVRFLAKPPKFYPDLKPWQTMIASGGSKEEARKLADAFQSLVVDLMFEKKAIDEENDIIRAKALPGTKKRKFANKPNEFVTNDDFCPGCGLELKALPADRMKLWTDVFQRDLDEGFDPDQNPELVKPGLLRFRGWGLERQLSPERRKYIEDLRADIEASRKRIGDKYPFVHGVRDVAKPSNLKVSIRGSAYRLGDEAPRRFLTVLSDGEPAPFTTGSGRLELADAIVRQPVAMRVIANRVWRAHMGTGIVDTPSNFGVNGERPVHPELLDFLAQRFVHGGLSLKALHREIMMSATYQLSAANVPASAAKDSGNRLYWRANRRRMTAEQIRDAVLFTSGALDERIGGPSEALTPLLTRRTIYGKVSRYRMDEYLALFDVPAPTISAEGRFATNVPLQRLFFMNSDFMQHYAEKLARRVATDTDPRARIVQAYRIVFGREPSAEEVRIGLEYVTTEPMTQYTERRTAAANKTAAKQTPPSGTAQAGTSPARVLDKSETGMMSGVRPGPSGQSDGRQLPVTTWGRYMKALLTSNEFLFVE